MKLGTALRKRSPEKGQGDSHDTQEVDDVPAVAGTRANAPTQSSAPALHSLLRLPHELWLVLAGFLIPASPYLKRPGQPTWQFPIAAAMRDLHSLSIANTALLAIVRKLRKSPQFSPWRELASRSKYEFHNKTEAARQQCIELYDFDPVFPTVYPQLMSATAFRPAQLQTLRASLTRNRQQVQELRLHLNCNEGLEELGNALSLCPQLRRLALSTDRDLSRLEFSQITGELVLDSLTLRGAHLQAGILTGIVETGLHSRLQTLALHVKKLSAEDFKALVELGRHARMLSTVTVGGAKLNFSECDALGNFLLESRGLYALSLGTDGGCISIEGAKHLLKKLSKHRGLASLALHNLEPGGSSSIIAMLASLPDLQEVCWGGKPDDAIALCHLPTTMPHLRSLEINSCGLNEKSWQELATSLESSKTLSELRIVGERLPDSSSLAHGIESAGNLHRLCIENCDIREHQAQGLAQAIARNPSVRVLQVLLRRTDGDGKAVTQAFAHELRERGNLLQCEFSHEVSAGWFDMQERLHLNRLIGWASPKAARTATSSTTSAATITNTTGVGPAQLAMDTVAAIPRDESKHGRKRSPAQIAVRRYRSQAAGGNAEASFQLGECYRKGKGVRKDMRQALKHYRSAAVQGHAAAQYQLGLCHASGWGVARNPMKAVKWFRKAGRQGHAPAQRLLGLCYEKGAGIARNPRKAFECYKTAAKLGDARAQFRLGRCYAKGTGTAQDAGRAREWYRTALATRRAQAALVRGS